MAIGRKMRRKLAKVPQIQLFRFANMAEQAPNPLRAGHTRIGARSIRTAACSAGLAGHG